MYWVEEYMRAGVAKTANIFADLRPRERATLACFGLEYVEQFAAEKEACRPANQYAVVIEESEAFWVDAARRLELQSSEQDEANPGSPLPCATYRSVPNTTGLHEYQGRECVVYAVEQRRSNHGLHVPSRCGVRFVGDDSHWIVPALELDLGPLLTVP